MRILVTGAAGFIGSHLVDALLAQEHAVLGLDNFDAAYDRAVKEANLSAALCHARFRFEEADILDHVQLLETAKKFQPEAIVHLAAKAGVQPSLKDPIAYQRVNVQGTQNVLEAAKAVEVKQFLFASSSSVYGINPDVPWREDAAVLRPISPYAATKVAGELLGHVYGHLYGLRFVALRFFTVYGPRQRPDLAIHKFARLMLEGKPVPLYGDGCASRDYTFVDDVIQGICAALAYDGSDYEIFNLGHHRTIPLLELVHHLERALGVRAKVVFEPEKPGDVPQTCADIGKAARLLGYRPKTDFAQGLGAFKGWLLSQPQRIK